MEHQIRDGIRNMFFLFPNEFEVCKDRALVINAMQKYFIFLVNENWTCDELQSSCQKLGINLNLYDQNSKEFLRIFFDNFFKVGINWESLFDAVRIQLLLVTRLENIFQIDGKSTGCLIVNCRKGPVFPAVEFPSW